MRHPTKKQMQKVIDRLKTILPLAKSSRQLDMSESRVAGYGHECGTVHCLGGWYAVACKKRLVISKLIQSENCNFKNGADAMAGDLGFKDRHELKGWASKNPCIWGNNFGYSMFADEMAFNDAKTMRGIVKHLQSVMKRLPK